MATQLEDAEIKIKLTVDGTSASRSARKEKDKQDRIGRDEGRKKKQAAQRRRFGVDFRGAAGDVARGRPPGLGRFGRAAAGVAGVMGAALLAEQMVPALAQLLPGPLRNFLVNLVEEVITKNKVKLTSRLGALEGTKDFLLSRMIAGRDAGFAEGHEFFERHRKVLEAMQFGQAKRDLLTKGPAAQVALVGVGTFLKDIVTSLPAGVLRSILGSDEAQEEIRKVAREEIAAMMGDTAGVVPFLRKHVRR